MDLKYVRSELQKLTEIIGGWDAPEGISALERELALEKLRKLYEIVRFGADAAPAAADNAVSESEPIDIPVSLDLAEVLAIDPLPEAETVAGFESEPQTRPECETEAEPEPGADLEFETGTESEPEPGMGLKHEKKGEPLSGPRVFPGTEQREEFTAESEELSAARVFPEPEQEARLSQTEPVPAPEIVVETETIVETETAVEAELVAETEPVVEPEPIAVGPAVGAEPVAESAPDAVAGPVSEPIAAEPAAEPAPEVVSVPAFEPAAEPAPETIPASRPACEPGAVSENNEAPASDPAEKSAPQPVAPTLFELEEETVRHRRKQRVIMSLYDNEMPAAKPAAVTSDEKRAASAEPVAERSDEKPAAFAEPVAGPSEEKPAGTSAAAGIFGGKTPAAIAHGPADAAVPAGDGTPAGAYADVSGAFYSGLTDAPAMAATTETPATEPDEDDRSGEEVFEEITLDKSASGAVLGEVINHDVQTLADTIAPPRDIASQLRRSEPVTDLRRAIGINDKFLMIRDLFGGDGAAYEAAIGTLNAFDDLDDCMIYIAENYAWNANSDGAKFLMELLERKFA